MTLLLRNLRQVGGRALGSFLVDEFYSNAMYTHLQEIGSFISTLPEKRSNSFLTW